MTAGEGGLKERRVLVIEDEFMVRLLIEDTLLELGCELAGSASRFDDAMAKAESLTFDIAILDVNLAGQRTIPIAQALFDKGIAFIWATGYGGDNLPDSLRSAPIVHKPFRQKDLERALKTALQIA